MEDLVYIKDRYCQFKCPYKDNQQIPLGKFDHEFECYKCDESNDVEVDHFIDGLCEYCQVDKFIEEVRSYGIKI